MMSYDEFRTGLDFASVRVIVVRESMNRYAREGQCIRPSRARILGKWHELKLDAYAYYLETEGHDEDV